MPPSNRITISASVATRCTSSNESSAREPVGERRRRRPRRSSRSAAVGRPIRAATTRTTIAIESAPGDDEDDAPELEDVVHGADSPCCGGARRSEALRANRFLTGVSPQLMPPTDTAARMRLAALTLLALALSAAAATRRCAGSRRLASRSRTGAGRADHRQGRARRPHREGIAGDRRSQPADQWSPRVNGVPRGKACGCAGKNISFRVPAGRYRIVAQWQRDLDLGAGHRHRGAGRRSRRGRRHRACTRSATPTPEPLPADGDEDVVRAG